MGRRDGLPPGLTKHRYAWVKPRNLFAVLAQGIESIETGTIAVPLVFASFVGFWSYTGSAPAALLLTLLGSLPIGMVAGASLVALWALLRVLGGLSLLLSSILALSNTWIRWR